MIALVEGRASNRFMTFVFPSILLQGKSYDINIKTVKKYEQFKKESSNNMIKKSNRCNKINLGFCRYTDCHLCPPRPLALFS